MEKFFDRYYFIMDILLKIFLFIIFQVIVGFLIGMFLHRSGETYPIYKPNCRPVSKESENKYTDEPKISIETPIRKL